MKSQLKNPLVQQYVLEIVLPLVGYFFFDWSISVIIAFYFMDYLASEATRHRRHLKIKRASNQKSTLFVIGIIVSVLLFLMATYVAFFFLLQAADFDHKYINEVFSFLKSEGWLLLPIVILASHLKDVMTFYAPRRFLNYDYSKTMKFYFVEVVIQFVLICSGLFFWANYKLPDVPALIGFIVIKVLFDQLLVRKLRTSSQLN
jgi:hypothetical protein